MGMIANITNADDIMIGDKKPESSVLDAWSCKNNASPYTKEINSKTKTVRYIKYNPI